MSEFLLPGEVKRVAGRAASRHGSKLILSTKAGVILVIVLSLGTALLGPSCRSSSGNLPIGVYLPLTGPLASFGESMRNGVMLAVQEVNSTGGVDGKLLEVTYLDDEGDPEGARGAVRRLIENLHVAAILGGAISGNSLAAAPICQAQGVPMISPSSTNREVTEAGEFIVRVCYVDSFQGTAMATFAYNSLRVARVAIMSKSGDGYSEGLAEYFARTFRDLGGEVVAEVLFADAAGSLDAGVRSVLAAKPEAVFLPLYYQDVSQAARRLKERGDTVALLGGDGWDSPELLRLAADVVEGGYFTTHFSSEDRRGKVRTFVRMYREKYDLTPDATAALGYDAAHLLCESLARLKDEEPGALETLCAAGSGGGADAGLTDARARLRDVICGTSGFEGVTGEVTIDESRNALKPAVVLRVMGGDFRYAGVVRP